MVNARPISLTVSAESWPIAGSFAISRGAKTQAEVVVVELFDGVARGRGECVPYARYGESVAGVVAAVDAQRAALAGGLTRAGLQDTLPHGAARNALDCALWDIEAKRGKTTVAALIGVAPPRTLTTAFTISLGRPKTMAKAAMDAAQRPLLKVKLGGDDSDGGDPARVAAVRRAVPDAVLIVDANEGWTAKTLERNLAACAGAGVSLIEQPLPATDDAVLASIVRPVPICADESAHDRASLAALTGRYDTVNIKLDKAGGLTEAIAMADEAVKLGLDIMVGCMVGTSLAMAPAVLLAQRARYVDLDGPLLLARDREPRLRYDGSIVHPPRAELWG